MLGLSGDMKFRIVFGGVFLLGFLLGWNMLIVRDLKTVAATKSQKMQEAKKQVVLKKIAVHKNNWKPLEPNLAPAAETSWVIQALNEMAKQSNVTITSMSPPDSNKSLHHERLSFKVDAECTYHNLGAFASKIESSPRLMAISQLFVKKPAGKRSLQVSMIVSVFRPPVALEGAA